MKTTQRILAIMAVWFLTIVTATAQSNENSRNIEKFVPEESTQVIFSVDPRTNKIEDIYIKKANSEQQLYDLKAECYRCQYYVGRLEGKYKLSSLRLIPAREAVLTIHTKENLMPGEKYKPGDDLIPGTEFELAGIKTTVVANKEGTFQVRAQ